MKRSAQIVCLVLLTVVLAACSAVTAATPEPRRVPSTPSEGFYPLTIRTGIEDVDNIVDVVASGDIELQRSLIQFRNTKCTKVLGMGGPPKCREGEAEGTPVEVLPILGTEGHFFYKDNIEDWTGVPADGLYAVYEVSSEVASEPEYPPGKYAVMFVDEANQAVISLRADSGKIVRVDYILDNSPSVVNGWIERETSKIILAPLR